MSDDDPIASIAQSLATAEHVVAIVSNGHNSKLRSTLPPAQTYWLLQSAAQSLIGGSLLGADFATFPVEVDFERMREMQLKEARDE